MRYSGEVALGLVVSGARAGRVALVPFRLMARAPLVGAPLQVAGDALATEGRASTWRSRRRSSSPAAR
jgi:hypothetical protein